MLRVATRSRQAAGRITRDAILYSDRRSVASRAMMSRSIARCVWRADLMLALVLCARHSWVKDTLDISSGI
eukprot:5264713-Pyramimonas_sp.AAC.1